MLDLASAVTTHLAGGLAAQSLNVLVRVHLSPSRLHAPVSPCDYALSRRTVMKSAGCSAAEKGSQRRSRLATILNVPHMG